MMNMCNIYGLYMQPIRENMIQLDFFQDDEMLIMKKQISDLRESNDRVRKSLFAKNGELSKKYMDLLNRLDILDRNICSGGYQ